MQVKSLCHKLDRRRRVVLNSKLIEWDHSHIDHEAKLGRSSQKQSHKLLARDVNVKSDRING